MHRLISVVLIMVVLYSVIKAKNGGKDPFFSRDSDKTEYIEGDRAPEYIPEEKLPDMQGSFIERTLSTVVLNILKTEKGRIILEKMIQPVNTPIVDKDYSLKINSLNIIDTSFHIKTTKEGKGNLVAVCGHPVNITYRVVNMQDMIIESGKKSIRLGDANILKAIDNIIVGMKIGESRSAIVAEKFAYDAPDYKGKKPANPTHDYKIDITLESISSDVFVDNVKIFDDEVSFKLPILCGSLVGSDVKIMNLNGDVIFNSKDHGDPIKFRLGDPSYPVIFSYGLFNKQDKGIRTVIFSGKYLRSFNDKNHSIIFPNEQPRIDQFYMLEFSNITMDKDSVTLNNLN